MTDPFKNRACLQDFQWQPAKNHALCYTCAVTIIFTPLPLRLTFQGIKMLTFSQEWFEGDEVMVWVVWVEVLFVVGPVLGGMGVALCTVTCRHQGVRSQMLT